MSDSARGRTGVIANPIAGPASDRTRWELLLREIHRELPDAMVRTTNRSGEERAITGELLASGVDRLLIAGGDGTLHQFVDALLGERPDMSGRPTVGILPLGSGNDFARGLGIPLDPGLALRALREAREIPVDVGRITFVGEHPARSVHWINQSYLGFGANVVRRVALGTRPADQRAYTRAALREIVRARPGRFTLESDGPPEELTAMNLLVTNGRYSGSGMLSSPRADPTDGRFEMILVGPIGRFRLLSGLRRFRAGTHLILPEVRSRSITRLTVRSADPEALVEADGDIIGRLPAQYEVLPGAIRCLVPAR